jgi:hypothetical protein
VGWLPMVPPGVTHTENAVPAVRIALQISGGNRIFWL